MALTTTSTCKGATCQARLAWGIGLNGQRVPLDPKAPIYEILGEAGPEGSYPVRQADRLRYAVTHFATCRDVDQFSGGPATSEGILQRLTALRAYTQRLLDPATRERIVLLLDAVRDDVRQHGRPDPRT